MVLCVIMLGHEVHARVSTRLAVRPQEAFPDVLAGAASFGEGITTKVILGRVVLVRRAGQFLYPGTLTGATNVQHLLSACRCVMYDSMWVFSLELCVCAL